MKRTPLEQRILSRIRNQRMIGAGDRVAVAVSGGADSVALLRLLENLRAELGITLALAHFDHRLRGAESDQDAQFVAELARARGLEFFIERADVSAEARHHRWNLEDAARRLRYAFFRGLLQKGAATRIAVAHTADDQAETVLAHLIRGTGPSGLGAIHSVSAGIVRPLLTVRRADLREYLAGLRQPWREDSTNQDSTRLRSRIRAQLVPQLERAFSHRIVDHLCTLAQLSAEEQTFWDALVEDRHRALVSAAFLPADIRTLSVPAAGLLQPFPSSAETPANQSKTSSEPLPPSAWRPLTERLIRRLYGELKGDRRKLTSRHVEQVIRLASNSTSGKTVELPAGVRVERVFGRLVFSSQAAAASPALPETNAGRLAYQYVVKLGQARSTQVSIPEAGLRFRLKTVDCGKTPRDTYTATQILDLDSLSEPLILRNWLPGDAYTPCDRCQPRKLKTMLLAARVPTTARQGWPVLESAGQVIWARGMPAAKGFSASAQTRVGLMIEEEAI